MMRLMHSPDRNPDDCALCQLALTSWSRMKLQRRVTWDHYLTRLANIATESPEALARIRLGLCRVGCGPGRHELLSAFEYKILAATRNVDHHHRAYLVESSHDYLEKALQQIPVRRVTV